MIKLGFNKTDAAGLQSLLESLLTEFTFAVYQTVTNSFFNIFELKDGKLNNVLLKDIERGRVFGLQSEVRWLFREEKFHFTFLCENEELFHTVKDQLRVNQTDLLELERKKEHRVILWGERDTKAEERNKFWFEGRIPLKISYPLENKHTRVELTVVEYTEKGNWKSKFYRFKEVKNV